MCGKGELHQEQLLKHGVIIFENSKLRDVDCVNFATIQTKLTWKIRSSCGLEKARVLHDKIQYLRCDWFTWMLF